MIQTIDDLFELVKNTFRRKKLQYKYFYDERYWHPINEILSKITWQAQRWKVIAKEDIKKYMKLPEYYIDGYGNKSTYEFNHVIIESIRIPTSKEPTLGNIMYLGKLIGLFQAISHNSAIYDGRTKLEHFIRKEDINTRLDLFLDHHNLEFIEKYLGK